MRRLRDLTSKLGHETSGSDTAKNGHDEKNVVGADLVVFSSAISQDNVELNYARKNNVPIVSRAQYLSSISDGFGFTVAVSGTHGKTTATAMTALAMRSVNPTLHVGADFSLEDEEKEDVFITEACEYKRNFLYLYPDVAVILNCELDHTDYYRDEQEVINAFYEFSGHAKKVVVNGDDNNLNGLRGDNVITFGKNKHNHVRAYGVCKNKRGGYDFMVSVYGVALGEISLSVLGEHNVYNALSAIAVALDYGISFAQIKEGIETFIGVKRRLEKVGERKGVEVYSDYAHHPTEIKACISTLKDEKRLIVVFEPHTYSRTCDLLSQFAVCFDGADEVVFAPIFGAREQGDDSIMDKLVASVKQKMPVKLFSSYEQICDYLVANVKSGERIVIVGAGSIDKLSRLFLETT